VRRHRKSRFGSAEATLEMTPMIDVVFQLLIFFLVSIKPEDIIAQLDVSRPAPDSRPSEDVPRDMLTITIGSRIDLNGSIVTVSQLQRRLTRLASFSRTQTVLIKCTLDSRHETLVSVLDACANARLTNINIFTL
jgi:biopolymer transport protein ExbD